MSEDKGILIYQGEERRRVISVSQDVLDALVEKAAAKAIEDMQDEWDRRAKDIARDAAIQATQMVKDEATRMVGRAVLDKATWVIGIVVVAAFYYAQSKGLLK